MIALTLAQAKASRIPAALGYCGDSDKFVTTLNEAVERLMTRGDWVGTYGRFTINVTNGLITWPMEIERVEGISVCSSPIPIKNEWFEFVQTGPGQQTTEDCRRQLYDRGNSPLFTDIDIPEGQLGQLKIYLDDPADIGTQILFKAKDNNGNKIYSDVAGQSVEGFYAEVSASPYIDAYAISSIYGVIKPVTKGAVRVYQYVAALAEQNLVAVYEPEETTPSYRRSLLPGLGNPVPDDSQVTVIAKLAFRPAVRDTDFLLINNIPALKEMCVSVKMQECEKWAEAEASEARAVRELEKQLDNWLGNSGMPTIQVQNAAKEGCPVENLI